MIVNFKCKETEKIFNREWSAKFPPEIQERARNKLQALNYVNTLHQLQLPKSNHLKALKGEKRGQYSIRINNQWRICFEWHSNNVYNVEITDYH